MYPREYELQNQKRKLKHRVPIVKQGIIIEDEPVKTHNTKFLPLVGAVIGLTSLAIVGTTLAMKNKNKLPMFHHGPHMIEEETTTSTSVSEEEGFAPKFKHLAKKAAIPAVGAAFTKKRTQKKKKSGIADTLKGAAITTGVTKALHKSWGTSDEEQVQPKKKFSGKIKGALTSKKAALAAGVGSMLHHGGQQQQQHPSVSSRIKNKLHFPHMLAQQQGYESDTTTTTSISEDEGFVQKTKGFAKKAAVGVAAGAAAKKLTKSSSSTSSTSTSYEEEHPGWGQKVKGVAKKAAAGAAIKKFIHQNPSTTTTTTTTSASEDEGLGQKMTKRYGLSQQQPTKLSAGKKLKQKFFHQY